MIQILKPKEIIANSDDYDKISIILHSNETNEIGKGEIFVRKRE
jgi:nitrogen regulatory protein PII